MLVELLKNIHTLAQKKSEKFEISGLDKIAGLKV